MLSHPEPLGRCLYLVSYGTKEIDKVISHQKIVEKLDEIVMNILDYIPKRLTRCESCGKERYCHRGKFYYGTKEEQEIHSQDTATAGQKTIKKTAHRILGSEVVFICDRCVKKRRIRFAEVVLTSALLIFFTFFLGLEILAFGLARREWVYAITFLLVTFEFSVFGVFFVRVFQSAQTIRDSMAKMILKNRTEYGKMISWTPDEYDRLKNLIRDLNQAVS